MSADDHFRLLSNTAQGDHAAFSQLYALTSARLFAVSLQILGRRDLAEDALQDAFVKIWHNAGEYQRSKGEVLAWMISIVRYRAIDILRSAKSRKESSDEATPESVSDDDSPDEALALDREKTVIDDCMNSHLDKQQQQIIELAYFKGLTHSEIVSHTKHPLGSVKSWIRRGLKLLQRCIER
ncbi:MAG TPA: sigma-70 family RNA polymerase sigma factor [Marinagarivorans sp.]